MVRKYIYFYIYTLKTIFIKICLHSEENVALKGLTVSKSGSLFCSHFCLLNHNKYCLNFLP